MTDKLIFYIVNRKIKYDRLLHGISPEGVNQLFANVKQKVEARLKIRATSNNNY